MNEAPHDISVSVLGLGSMGAAIAAWLQTQGRSVTVWNRTQSKAEVLLDRGALWADSPAAALEASPLAFTVVDSYQTVGGWVGSSQRLDDTTLVNITTGAPEDARVLESTVNDKGGLYLDAALFCYPDAVGNPDSAARFSGSLEAWTRHGHLLESIGGDIQYLGERVDLANAVDGAWISFFVPALVAALEAAAFAASYDVPLDTTIRAISTALPVVEAFLKQAVERIGADDLESENPVSLYEHALSTVIAAAERRTLPATMSRAAMAVMNALPDEDRAAMDLGVVVRRHLDSATAAELGH